ncbi:hypothetical protein JJB79_03475 [Pantoea eucrina]|uniref:Uncharacterized protein n=1 Tax=Pantoea eucrina TaxID=472693 RepID=A0ABS1Z264_9GAMM|nr:hypothetical protein [Pantoea eucrina]MBM0746487.1 hypothetical protein [Pantoea eucrina]
MCKTQHAHKSTVVPALSRTCIDPVDIALFQAAVFYCDPTLLKFFGLKPDDVQLKDQLAVMGKYSADRNAQRRHEQSKVNKQLKALTKEPEIASPLPTFQRHAGVSKLALKNVT